MSFKEALSFPSSPDQNTILNGVVLAVSLLSALGSGWMILSFALFAALRKCRHHLILGLAISDFCTAINFISSASLNLHGPSIGKVPGFCGFNGFMIQNFVVQTDYWVLTIAVCTYFIIADHQAPSSWMQDHRRVVWAAVWTFPLIWAILGITLAGYGDTGAWCWFTGDRARLLVNFIPRWVIVITICGLYIRLYLVIRKSRSRFTTLDEDTLRTDQSASSGGKKSSKSSRGSSTILPLTSSNVSTNVSSTETAGQSQSQLSGSTTYTRLSNTNPALRKISYQMMTYPIIYMLVWIIPSAVRIYSTATGKRVPFGVGTLDKACIVVQGFADAMIYGFNESTYSVWKKAFRESRTFRRFRR